MAKQSTDKQLKLTDIIEILSKLDNR